VPSAEPWFSQTDIHAGRRWSRELHKELEQSHFGILCVTPSNAEAPWLLFEAGAIAKVVETSYVCPLLLGAGPADLPEGPLSQFQAFAANREGVRHVVRTLNTALASAGEREDLVDRRFDSCWSGLEEALAAIPPEIVPMESIRTPDQKLDEVLDVVRQLGRMRFNLGSQFGDSTITRVGPSTLELPHDDPSAPHIRRILLERMMRGWLQKALDVEPRLQDRGIRVLTIEPREDGVSVTFVRDDTIGGAFLRGPAPWTVPGNQFRARVAEPLVLCILRSAATDEVSAQRMAETHSVNEAAS
jgi:hypothetical protein